MQEPRCCGTLMYQEIDRDNNRIDYCKFCGKTIKSKHGIPLDIIEPTKVLKNSISNSGDKHE